MVPSPIQTAAHDVCLQQVGVVPRALGRLVLPTNIQKELQVLNIILTPKGCQYLRLRPASNG